jgi:hypothetical protein
MGPASSVILGYQTTVQRTYLLPACNQSVFKTIFRSTFKADAFFTTNVTDPLQLDEIRVTIPTLVDDIGTTVLPVDGTLAAFATLTSNGTTTTVRLTPTSIPGADLGLTAALSPPVTINGPVNVMVTFGLPANFSDPLDMTGLVPAPPAPENCFNTLEQQGSAMVALQNMSMGLNVAERLVTRPENVTVTPEEPVTLVAHRCPDVNGIPGVGLDGVPGTPDDLCLHATETQWTLTGDIGSLSTSVGSTTELTPALPPGTSQQTGQVIASLGDQQAVALVTVTANQLVFADSGDQETGSVPLFQPGLRDERRIRFERELIEALERLVAGFAAFPRVAAFFQRQLDLAGDRLRALVPEDARFTAGGPDLGTGDVPATLTSVDATGDPIETYDLTLRPGSPVRSVPLVAIPLDSRIASGPAGGLVFVRAEPGGRLVVQAPGYADGVAEVTDGDTE